MRLQGSGDGKIGSAPRVPMLVPKDELSRQGTVDDVRASEKPAGSAFGRRIGNPLVLPLHEVVGPVYENLVLRIGVVAARANAL